MSERFRYSPSICKIKLNDSPTATVFLSTYASTLTRCARAGVARVRMRTNKEATPRQGVHFVVTVVCGRLGEASLPFNMGNRKITSLCRGICSGNVDAGHFGGRPVRPPRRLGGYARRRQDEYRRHHLRVLLPDSARDHPLLHRMLPIPTDLLKSQNRKVLPIDRAPRSRRRFLPRRFLPDGRSRRIPAPRRDPPDPDRRPRCLHLRRPRFPPAAAAPVPPVDPASARQSRS